MGMGMGMGMGTGHGKWDMGNGKWDEMPGRTMLLSECTLHAAEDSGISTPARQRPGPLLSGAVLPSCCIFGELDAARLSAAAAEGLVGRAVGTAGGGLVVCRGGRDAGR